MNITINLSYYIFQNYTHIQNEKKINEKDKNDEFAPGKEEMHGDKTRFGDDTPSTAKLRAIANFCLYAKNC